MVAKGFDTDMEEYIDLPSRFSGKIDSVPLVENCRKGVTTSGAWCLTSSKPRNIVSLKHSSYELPQNHVRADGGIVKFLITLMLAQNTILDLGAGVGQYGRELIDTNSSWSNQYQAIDGAVNVKEFTNGFVKCVNLGVPQNLPVADLVMSLEVGEHIKHEMEDNYIHNLHMSNRKGILLSWGVLHQKGFNHINNHSPSYIIKRFRHLGYVFDSNTTHKLRSSVTYSWFKKSIYVFKRYGF